MALPLCDWTAFDLAEALWRGEVSCAEITAAVWERIDAVESRVGAYLTLCRDAATRQAREADERIAAARRGGRRAPPAGPLGAYTGRPWGPPAGAAAAVDLGPLTGIPGALKDNLCTTGVLTTCGSRMLHNFAPPYDASVVARLKEIAAPLLGKTNMDEFAMGSSTENSAFKPTRNPFDPERVPGGSSGGSAAAVAAGEAIFALGSDTGGSIRQPASFCGVVGLKPTYGRVSRFGLVAFASSLDQIGPFTRDVRDAALVMNVLAGYDPCDSTSVDRPVPDYLAPLARGVKGLRIGLPAEYFAEGIEPAVRQAVLAAVDALAGEGAEVVELSLPHTEYALACYYLVAPAEASSNLARYDGVRYGLRVDAPDVTTMFEKTRAQGFGPEVKRRIMLGTYALSAGYYDAYYLKALQVRTLIRRDFEQAFERCDLLATPTSPTLPFRLGEKTQDPLQMYLSDVCTIPVNLAGLPAISLPCALVEGLPVGLQLIAPPFAEERLFQAAATAERLAGLAPLRAPVAGGGGRS